MKSDAASSEFTSAASCGRASKAQLVWAVLFAGITVATTALMSRMELPSMIRYMLPLACVLLGAGYFRTVFRDCRRSTDELQRRIHLEASVGTCAGMYVGMMVYPAFQEAGVAPPLDAFAVLVFLVILYSAGYAVAKNRYR